MDFRDLKRIPSFSDYRSQENGDFHIKTSHLMKDAVRFFDDKFYATRWDIQLKTKKKINIQQTRKSHINLQKQTAVKKQNKSKKKKICN